MTDRPMRQVSLRRFRGEIATLREVVEVSRRDQSGNIQVLGYWTPYKQPIVATHPSTMSAAALDAGADSEEIRRPLEFPVDDEPAPRVIRTPDDVAVAVRADPLRAVPKPSQRKRR